MLKPAAIRASVWLCLALVAVQALLPRGLVCCIPENGRPALELSVQGRCVGTFNCGGTHHHGAPAHSPGETGSGLYAAHNSCEDNALRSLEVRPERPQLPAYTPVCAIVVCCLPAAALPTWRRTEPSPVPQAPGGCGPPLQLAIADSTLLRI